MNSTQRRFSLQIICNLVLVAGLLLAACGPQNTPAAATPAPATAAPAAEVYKDSSQPVEKRVDDLLARMTVDEKIGQMTQIEKNSITPDQVTSLFIGSVLSGGGGYPSSNTPEAWAKMVDGYQKAALKTRLAIPMIYGVDAVHGDGNLYGATIFPQEIGLGATNDPDLVTRIGQATASEMIATGIRWNFAPVVAVPQDIRWGRTYEAYSENTDLVTKLASAYVKGLQGSDLSALTSVLATPKHYIGDGGTEWNSSTTGGYSIDQGVTNVDEATLRKLYLPPYAQVVKDGAMSVMVSFSSFGGVRMSANKHMITDVLKGELGFQGFVVSDWASIDMISGDYYQDVVLSINAGVDMVMVPYDASKFISAMQQAIKKGDITTERLDDAVRRILRAKFALGLFEHPFSDPAQLKSVGSDEHRALAREAVAKSLVLLKNDNKALPLSKSTKLIYVAGVGADDIGMQSGGWTIEWQGKMGDIQPGTTILGGIQKTVDSSAVVKYNADGKFEGGAKADACVVVIGEQPYAEGKGDDIGSTLSGTDLDVLKAMRPQCAKMVVVMLSGRPLIVTDQLPQMDAFVAAWLPGTEGEGVSDVLFGDKPFTGKLPYTWPRSYKQLPFDFANLATSGENAPLFPFGFGLSN